MTGPDQTDSAGPDSGGPGPGEPDRRWLDAAQLACFRNLLLNLREERLAERTQLDDSLAEVLKARGDGTADDEHDPDGPTLSTEWSRIAGLDRELVGKTAAVEVALARIFDGTYGRCLRCSRKIGHDRLRARPTSDHCIDCARLLDTRR